MRTRPTIKDVAARAGVSRQTVSRVVNDKGEISEETRTRVLAAIQELGYRPNILARSMVAGRSCTIGCIAPSLIDYTFACIIDSAQSEARRQGYFILAASAPTDQDVDPLLEEMLNRQVDGVIVLNPHADGRYRYFQPLIERGMAIVYMNDTPHNEPVSSVRCDDQDGGYQATRYLIALGHRHIATIVGPQNEECTCDRLNGYQRSLHQAGLRPNPALTAYGDWSATSGYQATQQILSRGQPFTALFAQNDQMAVGAIRTLREAGQQVPDDVSVIGYDDIPLASYFDPPLTTLRQPLQLCGERAVQLLVQSIQDPEYPPEQVSIRAFLVERASCAALRP